MIKLIRNWWSAHPLPFVALIRRELLRSVRTVRLFLALVLLLAIGSFGVMGMWPRADVPLIMVGNASTEIVAWFGMLILGAACLLIPGYAGGAILEERNLDTFDLLRTSLIRPSGILVGKFINILGLFVLLMLVAMPLLSTTYFIVGVNVEIMFLMLVTVSIIAVTSTSIGLACSAVQQNPLRAIIHSYLWSALALGGYVIFLFLGALAIELYLNPDNVDERHLEAAVEWGFKGSPFSLLSGTSPTGLAILTVCAVQAVFCIVPLLIAWRRLCRPSEATVPQDGKRLFLWSKKSKPRLRTRIFRAMPTHRNPVFLREYRHTGIFRNMKHWKWLLTIILVAGVNIALFYLLYVWRERPRTSNDFTGITYAWNVIVGMFIIFCAPAVQAMTFVREREQDTRDLLQMTLLSPLQIASGKMKAGFVLILQLFAFAYLCSIPVLGIVAQAKYGWVLTLTFVFWIMLCALASLALGAIASMLVRRTSIAVPFSYALTAGYFMGPSFAVLILNEMTLGAWSNRTAESFALLLSPVTSGFQFVGAIMGRGWQLSNDPFLLEPYMLLVHVLAVTAFIAVAISLARRRWLGRQRGA
ncbi:MAG: ABC transporter permease [Candidatus Hydrogenedentales bacterium]|jgi:hypothetical protein